MLIDPASLSQMVDAVNAAYFDGRPLAAVERGDCDVALCICARCATANMDGGHSALNRL